jgi:hypothetical protein
MERVYDYAESRTNAFVSPNPLSRDRRDYNIKPFIGTLRLIRSVNELCSERGETVKGISKEEFGIFILSLKSYRDIDSVADKLLTFLTRIQENTPIT